MFPQVQIRTEKGEPWEGKGPPTLQTLKGPGWEEGRAAGSWEKGGQRVRVFDLEPRMLWMEVQHRIGVPEPLGRLLDTADEGGHSRNGTDPQGQPAELRGSPGWTTKEELDTVSSARGLGRPSPQPAVGGQRPGLF